jgi:transcriptional antiterminator RfaH
MRECSEQAARMPQGGARWYAVYTKPHEEQRAESNLRAWGVETFAPQVREGGEGRRVRPLFSRYVFARFEAERQLQKVSYTRGVSCVVTSEGQPLEVCEEVMDVLRSRTGESGCVRLGEELLAGAAFEIQGGALCGLNGLFNAGLKDQERVRILLTAVEYQAQAAIEGRHLRKAAHA